MNTPLPNLERRLQSFVNRGIVTQVDHAQARCRVQIDSLETDWLPFAASRLGKVKVWNPPSIGEQVMVISETGELATGLVTTAFNYDDQPMPSSNPESVEMHCDDGARFIYNHVAHSLEVLLPNDSSTQITTNRLQVSADDVAIDCDRYRVACDEYGVDCQSYTLSSKTNQQVGALVINNQAYLDHSHSRVKSGSDSSGGVNA